MDSRSTTTGFCIYYRLIRSKERTGHAVVVVGIDDEMVYLNDPAFANAPQVVSHGDLLLAWLEMEEYYAIIQQRRK